MMVSRIALPVALFVACGIAAAQQTPVPVKTQVPDTKSSRAKKKPTPVAAPTPVAPSPVPAYTPPTPETLPAQPPHVTYAGGMLTIVAQNATLGDILNAVKSRTGATIDAPGGLSERVATQLGPAPPRQVLADLFKGSHYDYVMTGSDSDPQAVRSIILTRNSAEPAAPGGPATASGGAPAPAPGGRGLNDMIRRMRGGPGVTPQPVEEQPAPEAEVDQPEETPPVQPVPPPHAQGQGEAQPFPQQPPDMNQAGAQPGQPGQPQQRLRSPEELLQELQRMQQQQQQQQQQEQQQQEQQ